MSLNLLAKALICVGLLAIVLVFISVLLLKQIETQAVWVCNGVMERLEAEHAR